MTVIKYEIQDDKLRERVAEDCVIASIDFNGFAYYISGTAITMAWHRNDMDASRVTDEHPYDITNIDLGELTEFDLQTIKSINPDVFDESDYRNYRYNKGWI